jgi:hypothetical protein
MTFLYSKYEVYVKLFYRNNIFGSDNFVSYCVNENPALVLTKKRLRHAFWVRKHLRGTINYLRVTTWGLLCSLLRLGKYQNTGIRVMFPLESGSKFWSVLLMFIFLLFAGLLARRQFASGRSCDRPSRHRFSWFSSVFKQMLRWFPSSKLLLRVSHAALPT